MEQNEIMNYEDIEIAECMTENSEKSGIGTGVAMAIGAGLAFAVTAGVKLVKKGIAAIKAKKELHEPDHEIYVDDEEVERVTGK